MLLEKLEDLTVYFACVRRRRRALAVNRTAEQAVRAAKRSFRSDALELEQHVARWLAEWRREGFFQAMPRRMVATARRHSETQ